MKYIGTREIEKVDMERGPNRVEVFYKHEDDKPDSEIFSKTMYERTVSDEEVDASSLRDKRCFPVAGKILEIMLEENVYLSEVDYILQRVIWSFNDNQRKGDHKLWGVAEDKVTVQQLEDVLTK